VALCVCSLDEDQDPFDQPLTGRLGETSVCDIIYQQAIVKYIVTSTINLFINYLQCQPLYAYTLTILGESDFLDIDHCTDKGGRPIGLQLFGNKFFLRVQEPLKRYLFQCSHR
jgi:hypothetical protein